jgi:phospholipid transport system substrate-binding protein
MTRKFAFRRSYAAAAVAGFLLICLTAMPRIATAQAAALEQGAGAFIQNLGTQAIQILGPSVPRAQRVAVFDQLLTSDFDLRDAARFVLGPYANSFVPGQREEFMALFRENIAQTYADKLAQYAGEPFRVTGERPLGGGETIVTSEVLRRSGPPVHIDWHVINRNGHFLVTDVDINGVSQKLSERSQVIDIIQRNGGQPEALLAVLQQQLAGQAAPMSGSSYPAYPPAYR